MKLSELLHFTDRQLEAVKAVDTHKFVFYGGAKGGGKSHLLRWLPIHKFFRWFKLYNIRHARIMLACEDYPSLHDRHLVRILQEYPSWLGTWRASEREFHLKPEYTGGQICFRNLAEPSSYDSAEFAGVEIDELPKNQKRVFDDLRSILRYPNLPDEECFFLGTGNPKGVGLAWCKKLWIDKIYDDDNDDPSQYAFVQAFAKDNPYLSPGYVKSLALLPESERKALLEGSWDEFKGQFFPEWRKGVHTCAPFEIPRGRGIWYRTLDWGYAAPASVGWWWLSDTGTLFRVKELYQRHLKPSELAKKVKAMTGEHEEIAITLADPSIWSKGEHDKSIAEILHANGVPCVPADNERIGGWQRCREWLRVMDDVVPHQEASDYISGAKQLPATWKVVGSQVFKPVPPMIVFDTCYDFIRTVPTCVYDDKKPEDLDTTGEDHCADDFRYLANHLQSPDTERQKALYRAKEMQAKYADMDDTWRARQGLAPRRKVEENDDVSTGW